MMGSPSANWFFWGCVIELLLAAAALLLAWWLGIPLLQFFQWNLGALFLGIAATLPLFALLAWVLISSWEPLARIRRFLEVTLKDAFANWSWAQIGVMAILAGVAEELFFRGVLQTQLEQWIGRPGALLLASAIFGLFHSVTKTYAILVTGVGIYLGWLWIWSENLLVPVVAHALYDFVALAYCLRVRSEPARSAE
jgi:uncharacterized protein